MTRLERAEVVLKSAETHYRECARAFRKDASDDNGWALDNAGQCLFEAQQEVTDAWWNQ